MTPSLRLRLGVLLAALLGLPAVASAQIAVDGVFFDWTDSDQVDVDTLAEGLFPETDPVLVDSENRDPLVDIDLQDVFARVEDGTLYVRVKLNESANFSNTATDADYHGGAGLTVYLDLDNSADTGLTWDWWTSGFDLFFSIYLADENGVALPSFESVVYEHDQLSHAWGWVPRDQEGDPTYSVAWNASYNDVEIGIPLSLIQNPAVLDASAVGNEVGLLVYTQENESPWYGDRWPQSGSFGAYTLSIGGGTATEASASGALALRGAVPNPAAGRSEIRYTLASSADVRVELFDVVGRRVATLAQGPQGAGDQRVAVETAGLPAGLYVYRVAAGAATLSGTLTVVR